MEDKKTIIVFPASVDMDDVNAIQNFDSIKKAVAVVLSSTPLEPACLLMAREVIQAAKSSTIETLWGYRLAPVYRLHSHGPVRFDDVVADVDHLMYLFEMKQMSADEMFEVLRTNGSSLPRQPRSSLAPTVASAPAWPASFTPNTPFALPTSIPFASTMCTIPATANYSATIAVPTPTPANEVSRPAAASFKQTPFGSTTFQGRILLSLKSVQSRLNAVWKDVCSTVKDREFVLDNLLDWKEASGPLFVRYEHFELEESDDILRNLDMIITDRLQSADSFVLGHWHDAHGVIIGLYLSLKSDTEDVAQAQDAFDKWDLRFWASFRNKKERTQGLDLRIRQSSE
ncbi:hypothetical protein LQW54_008578 [Pestalotiopsis sp. IQ-011]